MTKERIEELEKEIRKLKSCIPDKMVEAVQTARCCLLGNPENAMLNKMEAYHILEKWHSMNCHRDMKDYFGRSTETEDSGNKI